jgi:hypothetical protein
LWSCEPCAREIYQRKQKPNKSGNRILNGRHVDSVISETEWIVELIAVDLNLSRLVRAPRVRSVNRRAGRNTRHDPKETINPIKRTAAVLFKHISLAPGPFLGFSAAQKLRHLLPGRRRRRSVRKLSAKPDLGSGQKMERPVLASISTNATEQKEGKKMNAYGVRPKPTPGGRKSFRPESPWTVMEFHSYLATSGRSRDLHKWRNGELMGLEVSAADQRHCSVDSALKGENALEKYQPKQQLLWQPIAGRLFVGG